MSISAARFFLLFASLALAGCASPHNNPKDPFESFNRGMHEFNDSVDKAMVKPVAKGYNAVMPAVGKIMVRNFLSNLDDVVVTANDVLQFKLGQAVSDTGRLLVNSTVGILGVIDVASEVGLEKHNEDFGQTLGHWGIGSGPYLVLPLLGPSSVRDGVGLYADNLTNPTIKIPQVDTRNQVYTTRLVSKRAGLLDQEGILNNAMIDRYSFIRDAYLQRRQNLVYDGSPPREKYDDEDEDDAEPSGQSAGDGGQAIAPPATAPASGDEPAPEQQP